MRFLVIGEARDTIVGDDVRRLRQGAAATIERVTTSGKLVAGGVVAGRRMPFMLLDVDSTEELLDLLGSEMVDNFNCQVHPVLSFESLREFFESHPA